MRERSGREAARVCASAAAAVVAALALLASASAPAGAGTVQKCVAADGHVTLTSGSCGAGDRLVASYDAVPEDVPASAQPAAAVPAPATSRGQSATRAVSRGGRGGSTRSRSRAGPDRCAAARDRRDRTLQRVGLKRNFDLLRKLDDEVWAACR